MINFHKNFVLRSLQILIKSANFNFAKKKSNKCKSRTLETTKYYMLNYATNETADYISEPYISTEKKK